MKKRSKLDLSPEVNQQKSQAVGFGPEEASAKPATEAKHSRQPEPAAARQPGTAVDDDTAISSRALLLTSMAVVAVGMALLFLLKRR